MRAAVRFEELTASETGEEVLTLLLHDPEWLATEFEAIMNASGIYDASNVASVAQVPVPQARFADGDAVPHGLNPADISPAANEWTRLRSPPTG